MLNKKMLGFDTEKCSLKRIEPDDNGVFHVVSMSEYAMLTSLYLDGLPDNDLKNIDVVLEFTRGDNHLEIFRVPYKNLKRHGISHISDPFPVFCTNENHLKISFFTGDKMVTPKQIFFIVFHANPSDLIRVTMLRNHVFKITLAGQDLRIY
ncbi:hypothetical protein DFS34DRAFT_381923 [Phlyctochytrium arcticum]|nr:hypothetical protein DFS34DRAFT_381923 [Phlyctochytrium arcticum]